MLAINHCYLVIIAIIYHNKYDNNCYIKYNCYDGETMISSK